MKQELMGVNTASDGLQHDIPTGVFRQWCANFYSDKFS